MVRTGRIELHLGSPFHRKRLAKVKLYVAHVHRRTLTHMRTAERSGVPLSPQRACGVRRCERVAILC